MLRTGLYLVMTTLLLVMTLMLAGCGGGGGGEGALSSAATLGLAVNKTTVASGTDTVTATVTLTSLNSQPVNGVPVTVDMTYNNAVVGSYSGNTNTNGVVAIIVPVALVPADRTVYLQARSSGITSSSSLAVAVKAPVLATTIPLSTTGSAAAGGSLGLVLAGDAVSFKDYAGNPITNATIVFSLDSQTDFSGQLWQGGLTTGTLLTPGSTFSVVTDGTGSANTNLSALLAVPGTVGASNVVTFYYTLSTTYNGMVFTKQGSMMFTATAS